MRSAAHLDIANGEHKALAAKAVQIGRPVLVGRRKHRRVADPGLLVVGVRAINLPVTTKLNTEIKNQDSQKDSSTENTYTCLSVKHRPIAPEQE